MKALDTNVLVRYLTQDEPAQSRKANAIIASALAAQEKLYLDTIVLCEVVWVLRGAYGFDKETVAGVLDQILSAAQFAVADRDVVRQALAAYRAAAGDFADYLLGLRNRRAGCSTTMTFDRALKKSDLFSVF